MPSSSSDDDSDDRDRDVGGDRSRSSSSHVSYNNLNNLNNLSTGMTKILDVIEDGVLGPMMREGSCSTVCSVLSGDSDTTTNTTTSPRRPGPGPGRGRGLFSFEDDKDDTSTTYTSFNTSLSDGESQTGTTHSHSRSVVINNEEYDDDEDDWWNIMPTTTSGGPNQYPFSSASAFLFVDHSTSLFGGADTDAGADADANASASAGRREREEEISFSDDDNFYKPSLSRLTPSAQRTLPPSTRSILLNKSDVASSATAKSITEEKGRRKHQHTRSRSRSKSQSQSRLSRKDKKSAKKKIAITKSVRFDEHHDDEDDSIIDLGDLLVKNRHDDDVDGENKTDKAKKKKDIIKNKNNNQKKKTKVKNSILAFARRRHKKFLNNNKKDKTAGEGSPNSPCNTIDTASDASALACRVTTNNEDYSTKCGEYSSEEFTTVTVFEYCTNTTVMVAAAAAIVMASILRRTCQNYNSSSIKWTTTSPTSEKDTAASIQSNLDNDNDKHKDEDDDTDDDTVTIENNRRRWIQLWRDLLLLPQSTDHSAGDFIMNSKSRHTNDEGRESFLPLSTQKKNSNDERSKEQQQTTNSSTRESSKTISDSTDSHQVAASTDHPTDINADEENSENYDGTPLWVVAAGLAATAAAAATATAAANNGGGQESSTGHFEDDAKMNKGSDESEGAKMTSSPDTMNGSQELLHCNSLPNDEEAPDAPTKTSKDDNDNRSAMVVNSPLNALAAAVAATGGIFLWSSRCVQDNSTDQKEILTEEVSDAKDEEENEQDRTTVQSIRSSHSENVVTNPTSQKAASDKNGDIDLDNKGQDVCVETGGETETVLYPPYKQKNKKYNGPWKILKKFISTKQPKNDRVAILSSSSKDDTTSLSPELTSRSASIDHITVNYEEGPVSGDTIIVDTSSIEVNNVKLGDGICGPGTSLFKNRQRRTSNRKSKIIAASFDRSNKYAESDSVDIESNVRTKHQAYFEQYIEETQPADDDVDDQPKRSSSISNDDLRTIGKDISNNKILRSSSSCDEYSYADNSENGTVETKQSTTTGMKDINRLRSDSEDSDDIVFDDDSSLISMKPINIFKETTQEILKDVSFFYNREHQETFDDDEEEEDNEKNCDDLDEDLWTIDEGTIGSSVMDDRTLDSPIPFQTSDGCHLNLMNKIYTANEDVAMTLTLDESFSVVDDDNSCVDGADAVATIQGDSPQTTPLSKQRRSILSAFKKRSVKHVAHSGAVLQSTVSDDREDVVATSLDASPVSASRQRQPASPIHPFSSTSSKTHGETRRMLY